MSRSKKTKMSKKLQVIISGGVIAILIITGTFLYFQSKTSHEKLAYSTANVKEGSVNSSTLLSGTVKAESEEYVYYDPSRGTTAEVTVKVGDKVTKGQQLVQYNTSTTQAAYDTAVRNLNKVGRQINYLRTYGVPMVQAETSQDSSSGAVQGNSSSSSSNASYNQQLQDLNDAYANAQAEVNKTQDALNQTVVVSSVDGTVVEVDNDINPASKESQTIVHVASEGQLQVKGSLTEYDLANIKQDQDVKIKSKVYPEKEWTGKIAYISNYPSQSNQGTSGSGKTSTSNASNYEFKANITSPLENLKQGFSVSVEVVNNSKHLLVPVSAIVSEGKKSYIWLYDNTTSKVKKREVTLGNADGKHQEVLTGIKAGQLVITNPDKQIKENQKLDNVDTGSDKGAEVTK
ncbi:efflux RND transporter periplasmic adaptor subunit [Streptococcus hongkongensis]|nr:ABC transporter substrate-binding protein [Streptococcus uberis]